MHRAITLVVLALCASATRVDAAFSRRKPITIDFSQVSGPSNLTNFPVLVRFVDRSLYVTTCWSTAYRYRWCVKLFDGRLGRGGVARFLRVAAIGNLLRLEFGSGVGFRFRTKELRNPAFGWRWRWRR